MEEKRRESIEQERERVMKAAEPRALKCPYCDRKHIFYFGFERSQIVWKAYCPAAGRKIYSQE